MIPSTYLGLSSVCLSSGVLGALVPGQGCLLQLECAGHQAAEIASSSYCSSSGPFSSSEEAANAERHTHTHVRLVSGSLLLDLLYHQYTIIISTIL